MQRSVTRNTDRDAFPAFSPDAKKIAFESDRNADNDIWRMRTDGTNPVNITDNNGTSGNGQPDWQPLP